MNFNHNTVLQPLSVRKPSSKNIGGLIGEAWLLLLHLFDRILVSQIGFLYKGFPKLPYTTVVVTHQQRNHVASMGIG